MKAIKQIITIKAKPAEVYRALTDPSLHSKFTGSKAKATDKIGNFSTFDGYSHGKNIKLIKDKKIIQTWTSDDFPEDHYSEVTFEFKAYKAGTKLIFTQKKVPDENYNDISQGWEEYYWKPLKAMLE